MTKVTKKMHEEMLQAFDEIQMPRTPYVLDRMVVNSRFTDEQKYAQCVLEMSIAYDNLRLAKIAMSLKQMDIDDIKGKDMRSKLEKTKLEIELEQTQRAVLGAEREFTYLFNLRHKRDKRYTREDLNMAQPLEYKMRLETQALQDLQASGKVSVGNQEGLRQVDIPLHSLGVSMPTQRDDIENRYLEEGKIRAKIIIPSQHRMGAQQISELLDHVVLPTNVEMNIENISESPVADNYNVGFEKAIKDGCTHVVTLEDDQVLDKDSIIRLFEFALDNPDTCVGAYYPKRQKVREGVHIVLKGANRRFIKDDDTVQECKTLAMGLSIYPAHILKQIDFPWCKTTDSLSQDSYLSQKIRDKGYKLLCDTSIKIGHKDKDGEIYR